jgi:hypothetical protein
MADVTIGAGGDELVVVRDGDVNSEEAAEMDDGDPADDQPEKEEDEAEDVKGLRVRQSPLRKGATEKKAREDAEADHRPEERKGPAIFSRGAGLGALGYGESDLRSQEERAQSIEAGEFHLARAGIAYPD